MIVSERKIKPLQIVTPEIDKSWTDRIRAQQIVSERIDSYHPVSKPKISEKFHDQLRMVNRGVRNGSHDSGNAALHQWLQHVANSDNTLRHT